MIHLLWITSSFHSSEEEHLNVGDQWGNQFHSPAQRGQMCQFVLRNNLLSPICDPPPPPHPPRPALLTHKPLSYWSVLLSQCATGEGGGGKGKPIRSCEEEGTGPGANESGQASGGAGRRIRGQLM